MTRLRGIRLLFMYTLTFTDAMHERACTTGGSVYVHCQAGISRSPTVVAAHLMLANGWSCTQALDFLREKRDCVNPNIGFMGALLRLEGLWKSEGRIP